MTNEVPESDGEWFFTTAELALLVFMLFGVFFLGVGFHAWLTKPTGLDEFAYIRLPKDTAKVACRMEPREEGTQ